MKARSFLLVMVLGMAVGAPAAEDPYQRAESLAARREFASAEAEYRRQLTARPLDWRLRLGLARTILWSGRYAEAERQFAALVTERPRDPDALLGHAQAAYWSGDFRAARGRYRRLLDIAAQNEEARTALADLAIVAAPRYELQAMHRDDSQPYRLSILRGKASYFSDPLTRWDVRAAVGDIRGGADSLVSVGGGVSVGLPAWRLTGEAWAESFRFPDGEREAIGAISLRRSLPMRSNVAAVVEKSPLLLTATAAGQHITATRSSVSWQRDPTERWTAAAAAHVVTYSDSNRGKGAEAWAMVPIVERPRFKVRAGASAAWRDTDENRFRFSTFRSEQLSPGLWAYRFSGVYDPYWTPHRLFEGRLIVAAESQRFKVQGDAGYARDRALAFGPPTGPTPTPSFTFPFMIDRSFRPWRASAEVILPVGPGVELRARYRHDVTVFYRANEIEATLGGRL